MNTTFTADLLDTWRRNLPAEFEARYNARFGKRVKPILDFSFYHKVSAVKSSQIEGSRVDLNSYFNAKSALSRTRAKDARDIDNLVLAYEFAETNPLTEKNLLKAHAILSENLVKKTYRGIYRDVEMLVRDSESNAVEYEAARAFDVKRLMRVFFETVQGFKPSSKKGQDKEAFFYAALSHVFFVKIHPFIDGNGRTARLIEKWFLSEWIGKKAWAVESESYYYKNLSDYYLNLKRIGLFYESLNYQNAIAFLLMLPNAIKP
jgi:Fic family protein